MAKRRVKMHAGRPQRYGTQRTYDEDGEQVLYPIEEAAAVDERRAEAGLAPLAEETACAEIEYPSPEEQ